MKIFDMDLYNGKLSYLPVRIENIKLYKELQVPEIDQNNFPNGPVLRYYEQNDEWVEVEDNFTIFFALNVAKISMKSGLVGRYTNPNDGCIDLIFSKTVDRFEFMKLLLGLNDGSLIDNPNVEYHKCRAFRLIPNQDQINQSKIGLDGERTDGFKPIYVESHPALIKIFSSK